ncbi:transglycosylase domain-containing protein [Streptacidiphilus sp. N1-12]|uniref:Transglycosylase domain-containing protein n=2 Tax=Streptacidiphilus alkalitolerans TaxID=3342712 RepID=A0ABV6WFF2_9ACTN
MLAGTLVAGLALPAVGALGFSAKSATDSFNGVTDDFTAPVLSQASTIYDANGGIIAKVYSRNRTVVPLSKIAPIMQSALIDIEDNRFYQHGAIDLKGTLRALTSNASDGSSQGGSTLTQQLVKNENVELAGDNISAVRQAQAQTVGRKIQELKVAIKLEETLSKQQILADYLNITFFGQQAYGVEAAAERYFSVHASQLSVTQAALLAGLVQSPTRYDPTEHPVAAKTRRDEVLTAMATYGAITQAQATAAKATPLGLKVSKPNEGCITAGNGQQFFCDYVQHIFLNNPAFGATAQARKALWDKGGLQIHTTIDPKAQTAVEKSVHKHVYSSDKAATAMTIIQPGTGKILAMGQSRNYGTGASASVTTLNYNVDQSMGGGGGFPTGSTFKPVTAAAALENGYGMDTVFPSKYSEPYPAMTDCQDKYHAESSDPPDTNDSHSLVGPFSMPKAMAQSVNTYFVPLEAKVGLCNVVKMAGKLGLGSTARLVAGSTTKLEPLHQVQSLTLGVNNLTPLQMANVYATFAARGTYCSPTAVTSVTTADNKSLPVPSANCHSVMSQTTADSITTMLNGVVQDGTGAPAAFANGRPSAGKTGTTDNHYQVWFVGFTPQMAGATVVSGTAGDINLSNRTIGGVYTGYASGGGTAGPIWHDAMNAALKGVPFANFNLVPLPAPVQTSADKGKDKGKNGGTTAGTTAGNNGGTVAGATTGGNTGGNGGVIGGLIGGGAGGVQPGGH